MIQFLTDSVPGEFDILDDLRHKDLYIRHIDDRLIKTISAPSGGWTHESLQDLGFLLQDETQDGANAFLGRDFVGSTEV